MDALRSWLDDVRPVGSNWSNRDLARVAIEAGCTDPKAVWAAVALLDAAHAYHKANPGVPFDHVCAAIVGGMAPEHLWRWGFHYRLRLFRAWFGWRRAVIRRNRRRIAHSVHDTLRRNWQ